MNCDLQKQESQLVCTRCGFRMKYIPGKVLRNCSIGEESKPPEFPSLGEQMVHFASDMVQWAGAGFPVSAREERERKAAICRACDWFENGRCRECGCACGWASFLETKTCPHKDGDKWEIDRLERATNAIQ